MWWRPKFQKWALTNGCLNNTLLTDTPVHSCMRFCTSTVFSYENGNQKPILWKYFSWKIQRFCRCEQARYYLLRSKMTSNILDHTFMNRRTISVWVLGRLSNFVWDLCVFHKRKRNFCVFSRVKSNKKKCSISFLLSFHGIDKNQDLHGFTCL